MHHMFFFRMRGIVEKQMSFLAVHFLILKDSSIFEYCTCGCGHCEMLISLINSLFVDSAVFLRPKVLNRDICYCEVLW